MVLGCRHKKVAYLDTDVGQPEFTLPGCLSLHVLDEPITGMYWVPLPNLWSFCPITSRSCCSSVKSFFDLDQSPYGSPITCKAGSVYPIGSSLFDVLFTVNIFAKPWTSAYKKSGSSDMGLLIFRWVIDWMGEIANVSGCLTCALLNTHR
jgi:hypothetical protein